MLVREFLRFMLGKYDFVFHFVFDGHRRSKELIIHGASDLNSQYSFLLEMHIDNFAFYETGYYLLIKSGIETEKHCVIYLCEEAPEE